jgi:hypothetical protein
MTRPGEDAYGSGPANVTKLSRDDLPEAYVDLMHASA